MEVAQAEKAFSGDAQRVNGSSSAQFTWNIHRFSTFDIEKLYSDIFHAGGYKWRILIFLTTATDHLSVYLDVADKETLPDGWSRHAHFSLSVISQNCRYTVKKEAVHKFNAHESRCGFASFIPLSEFYDPMRDFFARGQCTIQAELRLSEEQDKNELRGKKKADSDKPTAARVGKSSSSCGEFDALFIDEVQNLLEGKTSKIENLSSFCLPSSCSMEEIARGKKIAKHGLAILLSSNSSPDKKIDGTAKFLADFYKTCEQYEAAIQDMCVAQEKGKSVGELKTTVEQLSSEFLPIRNEAEVLDQEIAELKGLLSERKAKKALLRKRLEVLAGRATTSRQDLVSAEQDMRLSMLWRR